MQSQERTEAEINKYSTIWQNAQNYTSQSGFYQPQVSKALTLINLGKI